MVPRRRAIPFSPWFESLLGSPAGLVPALLILIVLPTLSGCGSQAAQPKPVVQNVQVAIAEDSVILGAGQTHQFTVSVTGTSNAAVTWRFSGCTGAACGSISATGLYTAPSLIPTDATIIVTATSQADPTKFDTVEVHQMAVAVSIAPAASVMVSPSGTQNFTATVQGDISNAGVTWALGPMCVNATCGALSNVALSSVSYTAPATPPDPSTVTLTATSIKDSSKGAQVAITIISSAKSGLLEGDYAFLFIGRLDQASAVSPADVVGHFHADSSGNVTAGVEDVNLASGVSQSVPFTGTYILNTDRRGSFSITTSQGTTTYRMTVDPSGSKGRFIEFDSAFPTNAVIYGTGFFERQDQAAFSLSALSGQYAVEMSGWMDTNNVGAVGRFTAGASGTFSEGRMDVTMLSSFPLSFRELTLTGAFGAPASNTGRGTAVVTLTPAPDGMTNTFNFAYYIVSDEKIVLMQTDPRSTTMPVLNGQIRRQNGSFSVATLNAPAVFSLEGDTWFGTTATAGRCVPDGLGSMTGIIDQNGESLLIESLIVNMDFVGSYSVDWDGRSVMTLELSPTDTYSAVAYFFGQNEGFLMKTSETDFGRGEVALGSFKPQAAGPFTVASASGSFRTNTLVPRPDWAGENDSGLTTFDGARVVTSTMDASDWWHGLYHVESSGTFAVTGNGRGTLTFTSPSPNRTIIFWIISPTELVGISTADSSDWAPVLLEYEK